MDEQLPEGQLLDNKLLDGQLASMRDLPPGYTEWPAPARLRDAVACLWAQVIPAGGGDQASLVLPDACSDLIWEQGRGRSWPARTPARYPPCCRRGSPARRPLSSQAGGPALGVPLSELRDQRVDLADLRRREARQLPGGWTRTRRRARLIDLAGRLVADGAPDRAAARATAMLADPRARAEDVAAEVGLSLRQLRRRCHAVVGYGPKTLQRVLRFRRFVSQLDAGLPAGRTGTTWPRWPRRPGTPTRRI